MVCVGAPSEINYFPGGTNYENLVRTLGLQAKNLKRGLRNKKKKCYSKHGYVR
jgi:hypothetical protein